VSLGGKTEDNLVEKMLILHRDGEGSSDMGFAKGMIEDTSEARLKCATFVGGRRDLQGTMQPGKTQGGEASRLQNHRHIRHWRPQSVRMSERLFQSPTKLSLSLSQRSRRASRPIKHPAIEGVRFTALLASMSARLTNSCSGCCPMQACTVAHSRNLGS
jgi:hypothetical protein